MLVDGAGNTMNKIIQSVEQAASIMSEISAASQEQSSGIESVSRSIGEMDEMTQQNAALVEQAAASAESMHEQTLSLSKAVSMFKLGVTPDLRTIDITRTDEQTIVDLVPIRI
ncbi:MAG: hypothetical protein JWQ21_609 [Herminiimonas sp.]|nr:hypothetical protein [Herminiimonas sp.]